MQENTDSRSVKKLKTIYWWFIPIALIVCADEWIKAIGLKRLPEEGSLIDTGLINFAIHKNWGIAFDIPFKLELVILFSVIIGIFLLRVAYKNHVRHPDITFACLMIVIGALGNLYDRIIYGFTVDYIIILGRSAINLSDVIIVLGVVLLLLAARREKRHHKLHPEEPR